MAECVKVMVRCRPMNKRQKQLNCASVVNIDQKQNQVNLFRPENKENPKPFTFDHVFGVDSLQSYVYEQTAFSLVDSVLEGYNGTIFAYGQTGCGKTHTMMGVNDNEDLKGIIPRTFNQIVTFTSSQKQKKHLVQCSFIQIYNEQIHDLLGKNVKAKMDLKQSPNKGVYVKDLTMNIVKTTGEMEKYMDIGFKNRAVRETAMNKESSRSHSIFTIHIESQQLNELGEEKFKAGKLNLVDLAGSERQSKTHATGDGMKQAAKINLSLSALGNVISALVDGKTQHIPYRDSKLTRLLQDSLGGNTKTIMIAAISPASDNYEQTLSSLRYASRAKFIKNKPIINEDPKDALLRQYAEQIKALKMMLEGKAPLNMAALAGGEAKYRQGQQEVRYIEIYRDAESNVSKGDNSELQSQLLNKQERLKREQQEKQKLRAQLESLQNLIGHDNSPTDKKELERMKKLKEKLKLQKKKQQEYRHEKKKRDEELFNMEKSYQSLNEEVEEMRVRFTEIKKKYLNNLQEINDIREQHEREKQQLLDTIRFQQAEINKFSGICTMLLNPDQIEQIIAQSDYNDETRQWMIAPFYYRDRNVNFPKLGQIKTNQLIEFEKEKKELIFREMTRKQEINKIKATYKVSDVVRNARQHQLIEGNHSISNNKKNKNPTVSSTNLQIPTKNVGQLAPLKMDSTERMRSIDDEETPVKTQNTQNKIKLNPISNGHSRKQFMLEEGGIGNYR